MPGRRDRLRVQVLADDRHGLIAKERRATANHLVQHRSQAVEVAPGPDLAAHRLLRRHVRDRPHHHPGLRKTASVDRDRQAEVADLRPPIRRQPDVARLQITVRDPLLVRKLKTPTGLEPDLENALQRQPMVVGLLDQPLHVAAAHQLRHDERLPVLLTKIEHRHDLRMRTKPAHRLRLTLHTLTANTIQPLRLDQRKRNITVKQRIVRKEDILLATLPKKTLDHIAARNERRRLRLGLRRRDRCRRGAVPATQSLLTPVGSRQKRRSILVLRVEIEDLARQLPTSPRSAPGPPRSRRAAGQPGAAPARSARERS